ncbi:protein of unknown function [Cognatiyoonia koreensis]|uniref:DUF4345 domain-containing protein n=1 Tax=Cognatiyoonia koreensis TaxID=364200 RepID=A0A1I0PD05_9RHOB|nr:DUF4345 family protein [Cognatiyoonia koreensis]SEW12023.1 protein of unknown function [Cognatiyoonia koreensis]
MEILNYIFVALSIGLGCFGWLAPNYTMSALDLKPGDTTMGTSEIRASAGCLFVGLGVGALLIGTPLGFAMIGFAWTGAAIGRMTSIILDGPTRKKWIYFIVEISVGLPAIALNWPVS